MGYTITIPTIPCFAFRAKIIRPLIFIFRFYPTLAPVGGSNPAWSLLTLFPNPAGQA